MSDNSCKLCGQPLDGDSCVNPECELNNLKPSMSMHGDFFPDDLFDEEDIPQFSDEQGEVPELSDEEAGVPELSEEPGELVPEMSSQHDLVPELSDKDDLVPELSDKDDLVPEMSIEQGGILPEMSKETGDLDLGSGIRGPFLSLEQASQPIDHTGTILFEGILPIGPYDTKTELLPGAGATRLTDNEHYREIQTVLRESITDSGSADDSGSSSANQPGTGKGGGKGGAPGTVGGSTNRPEVSRTLRLPNPIEEHTLNQLPNRGLSVPSDSASLEKRKEKGKPEEYSLDSKDYKIVAKVGEGGSGVVYEAQQLALKRRVAVKVLKQRRMKAGSRSRTRTKEVEKRKARFLHEVNITAKLQHPNIIPLYDLGINAHGEVFYSMKLISEPSDSDEQQSWASLVRARADKDSTAGIEKNVQIFEKVCDAMRYAHAEKVVHRDLKPENVMVGDFGEVLVIDWGMALDLSDGPAPFTAGGTTAYMAPEMGLHYLKQSEIHKLTHKLMVALGEGKRDTFVEAVLDFGNHEAASQLLRDASNSDDIRKLAKELVFLDQEEKVLAEQINDSSDIYLLGAILYEIAIGHPPHFIPQENCKSADEKHHREFWLSSNHRIQRLVQVKDPLRLSLCNIALGALQKEQKDRFQSVDELKEAIKGFKDQVQSLQLENKGREELKKAEGGEGYTHLLPALESFRGAQALYPAGEDARRLQTDTACTYARRADSRKDYDAGLSILQEYAGTQKDEKVVSLVSKMETGKRRVARNKKLAAAGWAAAIILPLAVWGISWLQIQDVVATKIEAEGKAKVATEQFADAEVKLATADEKLAVVDEKLATADEKQRVAEEKSAKAEDDAMLAMEKAAGAERKVDEAEVQLADAATKLDDANMRVSEAVNKEMVANENLIKATTAEENAKLAAADAEIKAEEAAQLEMIASARARRAQEQVEKVKFESAENEFSTALLPIPLDLRKGKFAEAKQRLIDLRDGDLQPQFKNGWVARHFAKVVNVEGVENRLGEDTSVTTVLHGPNGDVITVGSERGTSKIWKTNSADGMTAAIDAQLPDYGKIAHAAISENGQWLALALDQVVEGQKFKEHFWIVNLTTGRRAGAPANAKARNDQVVGCKQIALTGGSNSGLQLITVEELSSYNGLKQRIQVAQRTINGGQQGLTVGAAKTTPVSATTRNESNVRYTATIQTDGNAPQVALVYQSLNPKGADNLVLETLSGRGKMSSDKMEIEQFPTAMHIGTGGKLYCGHADGRIKEYKIGQLAEASRVGQELESAVKTMSTTKDGKLVTGTANGVLAVLDSQLNIVKRLVGQSDALTSTSISEASGADGFQLASGGANGHVRVWSPDGTRHDASIRKQPGSQADGDATKGDVQLGGTSAVTCGTVDQSYAASDVPATAYGTADGRVYYFNSKQMRARTGGVEIKSRSGSNQLGAKRMTVEPPPGTFDSSFDRFDSFGIVGDQFVLLQSDGRLFSTTIETDSTEPSSKRRLLDTMRGRKVDSRFLPLLASTTDQDYFFTNSPANESQILYWSKRGTSFRPASIRTNSKEGGRIKRLRLSQDGKWLAVIREVGRKATTGEYVTEILEVNQNNPQQPLRSATNTNRYRVGDPAFVGFSADSRNMILHFHKSGVDRETWAENWSLAGSSWQQSSAKKRIANKRVDLVGWDGSDVLVTKINKRFYLTGGSKVGQTAMADEETEIRRAATNGQRRARLRNVQPTGIDGSQYVLFNQSIERFDSSGKQEKASKLKLENARDVRVFGDQAVVLDDKGFHLVDSDLSYVTMIARRKVSTQSLALSNDRLAISYDVGGLCRIMDVSGLEPTEIGRFDNASDVKLSADGKWATARRDNKLLVFSIENKFDKPVISQPLEANHWRTQWLGTTSPKLLIAMQGEGAILGWKELDPQTGAVVDSQLKLPRTMGIDGQLTGFELAPYSQRYLAVLSDDNSQQQIALWAVSETLAAEQLRDGFESEKLKPLSISFSEIARENIDEIGTRLVVLNDESGNVGSGQAKSNRVFMLASDLVEDDAEDAAAPIIEGPADEALPVSKKQVYNIFEIEGVIEVTDGRSLIDTKFSGDGRSLLEVDSRGVKVLLSKDW